MIELRHAGLYVNDIELLTNFYSNVFGMKAVVLNESDENILLDELLEYKNAQIITTKLITPKGQITGSGDMLELVKVVDGNLGQSISGSIYNPGMMHIAFGVENIDEICAKIESSGGTIKTQVHTHNNGNKLVFATDPEGNWIELIER